MPGYRGMVYVDKGFGAVLRITMEAEDVLPSFPVQRAAIILDFDFVKIGEQENLVPLRYVMIMREGRVLAKNEVEFRNYRKFSADAEVTFKTDEVRHHWMRTNKEQPLKTAPAAPAKKQ